VEKDLTLAELREKLIQDVDLILSEGYKKDGQPKIEIFRKEKHKELLCTKKDRLVAIVSDREFDVGVPCFSLDDAKGVADFMEKKFLKAKKEAGITLKVDGRTVSLKPFIRDFLSGSIKGMVSSLKGCEKPKRIEIHIKG
jgi:molybdopterin-guanine dinucleotide biosynthesis protein B